MGKIGRVRLYSVLVIGGGSWVELKMLEVLHERATWAMRADGGMIEGPRIGLGMRIGVLHNGWWAVGGAGHK